MISRILFCLLLFGLGVIPGLIGIWIGAIKEDCLPLALFGGLVVLGSVYAMVALEE